MKKFLKDCLPHNSIAVFLRRAAVLVLGVSLSACISSGRMPIVRAEMETPAEQAPEQEDAAAGEVTGELPVDDLVIVIDPGHGGDEEGGMYDSFVEKELTLVTAKAMKEELEKYEDVTVYLTRDDDRKMSLEERVAFAKEVQADFLFCLQIGRAHV